MKKRVRQQVPCEALAQPKSTKPKIRKTVYKFSRMAEVLNIRHAQHDGVVGHYVHLPVFLYVRRNRFLSVCMTLVPKSNSRFTLDELLAQITPDNIHSEVETGAACGNETW